MRDANFVQSMVFLSMHDAEDGAFGVILNRPSGKRLCDLVPDRDLGMLSMAPVYLGGPVGPEKLILAAFRWDESIGGWNWRHDLDLQSAAELVEEEDGVIIRAFAGYSGWGRGQLEQELKGMTWVVHTPESDLLNPLEGSGEEVWTRLIRCHGPVFEFLTNVPSNLGRN